MSTLAMKRSSVIDIRMERARAAANAPYRHDLRRDRRSAEIRAALVNMVGLVVTVAVGTGFAMAIGCI